jgi:ankyrin repeat protein
MRAALGWNESMLLSVLVDGGANVDAVNEDGDTALMLAATEGCTSAVSVLLSVGANVEIVNTNCETALTLAATNGHASIVSALLDASAHVETLLDQRNSALLDAAYSGHPATVSILLSASASMVDDASWALWEIIKGVDTRRKANADIVCVLLAAGADIYTDILDSQGL